MDVKKLSRFFLFNPDNIVIKTLEAATQLVSFNQRLTMRHHNRIFPYNAPHRHENDTINTFLSFSRTHYGTITVKLIVVTKTLLTDVYAMGFKLGLNVAKVLQDQFRKCGTPIKIWSDNVKESLWVVCARLFALIG